MADVRGLTADLKCRTADVRSQTSDVTCQTADLTCWAADLTPQWADPDSWSPITPTMTKVIETIFRVDTRSPRKIMP